MSRFPSKDAKDWTQEDIKGYNIKVTQKGCEEFFGQPPSLSLPETIEPAALEVDEIDEDNWSEYRPESVQFMMYAQRCNYEEARALDYAEALLLFTGYLQPPRFIIRRGWREWRCAGEFKEVDYPIAIHRFSEVVLSVRWARASEVGLRSLHRR